MTSSKKIKMYVYIIDGLNTTKKSKLKLSNKKINDIINLENKTLKAVKKQERYNTGNYNLSERIKLVLELIFSPIAKLFKFIKKKVNLGLHKRQIKKQAKLINKLSENEILKDELIDLEDIEKTINLDEINHETIVNNEDIEVLENDLEEEILNENDDE